MARKKAARAPASKKAAKTIATRIKKNKEKVLETAVNIPFLGAVAKKTGVSRETIYRWTEEDGVFKADLQKARYLGRENVNDMAESGLVKMIQGDNLGATRFWLQNNHDRYRTKASLHKDDTQDETIPEHVVKRFVRMITNFRKKQKKVSMIKDEKESDGES